MIVKTCRHNVVAADYEWPDCRRIVQLEKELSTARADVFAECARICCGAQKRTKMILDKETYLECAEQIERAAKRTLND